MRLYILLSIVCLSFACSKVEDTSHPNISNATITAVAYSESDTANPNFDSLTTKFIFEADLEDDYALRYYDLNIYPETLFPLEDTIRNTYTSYQLTESGKIGGTKTKFYKEFYLNDSTLRGIYNAQLYVRDWQAKNATPYQTTFTFDTAYYNAKDFIDYDAPTLVEGSEIISFTEIKDTLYFEATIKDNKELSSYNISFEIIDTLKDSKYYYDVNYLIDGLLIPLNEKSINTASISGTQYTIQDTIPLVFDNGNDSYIKGRYNLILSVTDKYGRRGKGNSTQVLTQEFTHDRSWR